MGSAATPSKYVEVVATPKNGSATPVKQMKTLTLDAFMMNKNSNNKVQNNDDVKELKDENQRLRLKLKEAEKERDSIRNKYENDFFEKMKDFMEKLKKKKKKKKKKK